jgi:hypothetical protein
VGRGDRQGRLRSRAPTAAAQAAAGPGGVAQLVAHLLCKQGVVGSSPIASTARQGPVPRSRSRPLTSPYSTEVQVDVERDQERGTGTPRGVHRDHRNAGRCAPLREPPVEVARIDRPAVSSGEDEVGGVVPGVAGGRARPSSSPRRSPRTSSSTNAAYRESPSVRADSRKLPSLLDCPPSGFHLRPRDRHAHERCHVARDQLVADDVRQRCPEDGPGLVDCPLRGDLTAAVAETAAARIVPAGVLLLCAALAALPKLVDPDSDVPHGQLVQPATAEVRRDVQPREHRVVRRRRRSQIRANHLRQPVGHVGLNRRYAGGHRTTCGLAVQLEPLATSSPWAALRATYSSTHSGKIRRERPSLSERSSPVRTSSLVLLSP